MYNKRNVKQDTDVRYIVVHSTSSRPDMMLREIDKLPFHFLITRNGRLINLKPMLPTDFTVEIAWLGGLDKHGRHVDNRTEQQNETLFNTLLVLTEKFDEAEIISADKLYVYGYANPGFDLKAWLNDYIPAFLQDAA